MGQAYGRYDSDFELFVIEQLEMDDVDFTKSQKGEYMDKMAMRLHTMWDSCWSNGYEYGYDNGARDERVENRANASASQRYYG